MSGKNQETEDAFMDELREAIGTFQSVSFHLLIRRVRQTPYEGEITARGYAWNIRDIIGHNEHLMRRFLESVSIPRDVEEILSDPSYDYQGDRGDRMFWGVGGPRLITDAQRAEMRRRRLGGWIEPPPAKRVTFEKKDDPKKKDEGKAGELHQPATSKAFKSLAHRISIAVEKDDPKKKDEGKAGAVHRKVEPGSSKAFQSDNQALASYSKGRRKGEHSRNTSESASAHRISVEKDDPKKKDEGKAGAVHRKVEPDSSKAFQSDNQALASCSKGRRKGEHSRNASESSPAKQIVVEKKDDPKKKDDDEAGEVHRKVEPGSSKAFQSDNQALASFSKGRRKGEHSRNSSESPPAKRIVVEKDDSKKKEREESHGVQPKVEPGTSKAFHTDNHQALPSCFKDVKKGEHSRNTSESASVKRIVEDDPKKKEENKTDEEPQKVEPGTSTSFQSDNQTLPSFSNDEREGENSRNTFESEIKEDSSEYEEDLLSVEFENQTLQSFSEGKYTDVNSSSFECAEEEDYSEYDEQDLEEGSGDNTESFGVDTQAIPSCSRDGNTVENLNVSSESVKEEDSCDDECEGDCDCEDLSEVDSNHEVCSLCSCYSECGEADERSRDFSESANEDSIEDDGEREIPEEIPVDSYSDDQIVPVYEKPGDSSNSE